jgi:hypothetical protein
MRHITPTTALREPANYDLRGKISTRSNDLTSSLCRQGRRSARAPWAAGAFKFYDKERERHDYVEGQDRPAVVGIGGYRDRAGG